MLKVAVSKSNSGGKSSSVGKGGSDVEVSFPCVLLGVISSTHFFLLDNGLVKLC